MKAILLYFILLLSYQSFCQLKLPHFFGDGMVLQQKTQASIWGTDKPNIKIKITASWGSKAVAISDKAGNWKTTLETPAASIGHQVEIKGSTKVILNNIMIGEVWFCSGQSNIEMTLKGNINERIIGNQQAILDANLPQISFFVAKVTPSFTPQNDTEGKWKTLEPKTAPELSAVAYFYGKMLNEKLKVPIGLIISTIGGTGLEAWTDTTTLSAFKTINLEMSRTKANPVKRNDPGALFNGMVYPFLDFDIAGVIWYQGENNRYGKRAAQYKHLFPAMIGAWRKQWNQGDFPFYYVQIAPFQGDRGSAALVREGQLLTMQNTANTGMVVTQDIGLCDNIHPPQKREVGERLAYWALTKTYGWEGISYSGPIYNSMEAIEDKIIVKFDFAESGLSSQNKALVGFEIAGADSVFVPAKATIISTRIPADAGRISVSSDKVKKPIAVRYAFADCVEGNLFNVYGLPASPFRTDNWEILVK